MRPNFKICHSFNKTLQDILKDFPKSAKQIKADITESMENQSGDSVVGFYPLKLKKARIGIKADNVSKSGGLRLYYLTKDDTLIPVHIYKKKGSKNESKLIKDVRHSLKMVLSDIEEKRFAESLEPNPNKSQDPTPVKDS